MKKPPGIHAEPGCRDHFCVTRKLTSLFGADFDETRKAQHNRGRACAV